MLEAILLSLTIKKFSRDDGDEYYYYTIAKDYEWSFVAINVLYFKDVKRQRDLDNEENKFYLHHEQIDSLPVEFNNIANITNSKDNMLYFKIKLEKDMSGS